MPEEVTTTEKKAAAEEGMAKAGANDASLVKKAKKPKRQVLKGRANIQCTYNNTIVTLTDLNGAVLGWSSSGHLSFKGAKKSTRFRTTVVARAAREEYKSYKTYCDLCQLSIPNANFAAGPVKNSFSKEIVVCRRNALWCAVRTLPVSMGTIRPGAATNSDVSLQ